MKWHLSIRQRLFLGFGLMIVLIAVGSGLGRWLAGSAANETQRMVETDFAAYVAAKQARAVFYQAQTCQERFLSLRDLTWAQRADQQLLKSIQELTMLGSKSQQPAVGQEVRQAQADLEQYRQTLQGLVQAQTRKGLNEKEGLQGQLRAAVHAIEKSVAEKKMDDLTVLMLMCRRHEKDYMLRGDAKYLGDIAKRIAEFDQKLAKLDWPDDQKQLIVSQWKSYYASMDELIKGDQTIQTRQQDAKRLADSLQDRIDQIETSCDQQMRQAQTAAMGHLSGLKMMLAVILSAGLLIGLLVSLLTARSVTRPIGHMIDRISAIEAKADLTQRIDVHHQDEMGRLGRSFNAMIDALQRAMLEVQSGSREVAAAATQIAASSQQIAHGMQQQQQQVRQITQATQSMSDSSAQVARDSTQTAGHAKTTLDVAGQGNRIVSQTIDNMRAIQQSVQSNAQVIHELGRRSEEIGRIIQVINDIADQTNLLALNAAIEAARAGEHGRGFAVVADEVRKLADRTTKATEEIAHSIKAIQQQTAQAVDRMESGTTQVNQGVTLATQATDRLKDIVQTTQEMVQRIQAIAQAAEQQSAAGTQVYQSTQVIQQIVQQTGEGTCQAATAAEQLSGKAEQLQALVNRFKIQEESSVATPASQRTARLKAAARKLVQTGK